MATMLVDSGQLDDDLEDLADAIRSKGGTSADLAFPSGFVSAIQAIQKTGKDYASGTFTVPSDAESYRLDFGRSFNSYLFMIWLTDDSKADLINSAYASGESSPSFFNIGHYPGVQIGNVTIAEHIHYRWYRSSNAVLITTNARPATVTPSYIEGVAAFNTGFLPGYSYNYLIVCLD